MRYVGLELFDLCVVCGRFCWGSGAGGGGGLGFGAWFSVLVWSFWVELGLGVRVYGSLRSAES